MRPPVARSAANPWVLSRGVEWPELSLQSRGFGRNLIPAKALASAAKPERAGCPSRRRARVGGGFVLGLRKSERSSPARVEPTAARALLKLVPSKSLSKCCEGPK